jgi:acyl-coenzyme A synthetase/AMP-(fatty) acid ligase
MALFYYKNPEATYKSFKDGWFYSGDRGFLNADGSLILSGRNDELINRGGVKIDPYLIDQFLIDYPGIKDAAAFEVQNTIGISDIGLALVVPENFNLEKLKLELLKKFGRSGIPNQFYNLQKIPRNQMGKIMRFELTQTLSKASRKKD